MTIAQSAGFVTTGSSDQAAITCETEDMRRNVLDGNDANDTVRIKVVEDSDTSSRVLSQVEINCRDYFLRKSVSPTQPTLVRAVTPTPKPSINREEVSEPKTRQKSQRYTYIVQRGDTVWAIAKEHCTTSKAISRLNGLGRGNNIDIGQRLKLPDEEC